MKKINIFQIILSIIVLAAIIGLATIYTIILPDSISKYIVLFYLISLGILVFLLQISTIVEIRNLENNEHEKTFAYFQDVTWQSYIYHTIIIIPLIVMAVLAMVVKITQMNIKPEDVLQVIYWSIAIGNFIWFYYHIKKANTQTKIRRINLMLKLAVCIVSGVGLLMDVVSKVHFTKQFIVMAWTVLLMSYMIDKKTSGN